MSAWCSSNRSRVSKGIVVIAAVLLGILPLAYTIWSQTTLTVPVKVNVLAGVQTSSLGATEAEVEAEIRRIVAQAEKNLQSASTGIRLRADDIRLNHVPGGNAENGDGQIDLVSEWNGLYYTAAAEMAAGGIKIYITGGYQTAGTSLPTWAGAAPGHPPAANPDRLVTIAPAKQTDSDTVKQRNLRGNDLAHEIAHALTLGPGHPLSSGPGSQTASTTGHTQTPSNLMSPHNNGTQRGWGLTPAQTRAVQSGAKALGAIVTPAPGAPATHTEQVLWIDKTGDVPLGHGDLDLGWFMIDRDLDLLGIQIDLAGLFPDAGVEMAYTVSLDADGNPCSGVAVADTKGVDWIIEIDVTGTYPFAGPESNVTARLVDPVSGIQVYVPELRVERLGIIGETSDPGTVALAIDTKDSLQLSVPISLLGDVSDRLGGALIAQDLLTGEEDHATIPFVAQVAPPDGDTGIGWGKVAVVLDVGERGDLWENDMALKGTDQAAIDFGLEIVEVQNTTDADYVPNLRNLAWTGLYDLIIGVGFLFTDAMTAVAAEFPEQKFCIIDSVVWADNVMSIIFRENEMSALIGALAALAAAEHGYDAFGVVLGIENPVLYHFEAGVRFGMDWANDKVDGNVDLLYTYTGPFSDIALGKAASDAMLAQGAVGIYNVAGPVGLGDLEAVTEAHDNAGTTYGPPFYFGVDANLDYLDHTLASGMKRVDQATYLAVESVVNGTFEGWWITSLGLAEGGVGISDLDTLADVIGFGVAGGAISSDAFCIILENGRLNRATVSDHSWNLVAELEAGILDGSIVVPTANTLEEMQAVRDDYPLGAP